MVTTLSARGTSFGYGKRNLFGKIGKSILLNSISSIKSITYIIPNNFSVQQITNWKCIQFWNKQRKFQGKKQQFILDQNFLKEQPPIDKSIPGPTVYSSHTNLMGVGVAKFSMRPKTRNFGKHFSLMLSENTLENPRGKNIPGPGQYEIKASLNHNGSYFNSRFKNSGATVFSPSSNQRFKNFTSIFPFLRIIKMCFNHPALHIILQEVMLEM